MVLRFVQPFREQRVGGLAGDIRILNAPENKHIVDFPLKSNLLTEYQSVIYWAGIFQARASYSYFGFVDVCGGAFAGYRNSIIQEVKDEFAVMRHFGVRTRIGDDRALTNLVSSYNNGHYDLEFNQFARVHSVAPDSLVKYEKQQIRWGKGFMLCLGSTFKVCLNKNIYYFYAMLCTLSLRIVSIFWPIYLFYATFSHLQIARFGWSVVLFYIVARLVYNFSACIYPLFRTHDKRYLILMFNFIISQTIQLPVRVMTSFTFRIHVSQWGTR